MTRSILLTLVSAWLLMPACAPTPPSAASTTDPAIHGAESITPENIYLGIDFLASDALGGRDTPSPGLEAAAAYLVSQHRRSALEPAGENGTYYQRYPFRPRGADSSAEESFPPNVVAVVRGSDPALRDEFVVLSAHFDHVGIGRPMNGDSIYNGADDNASGTAALLEVARAFSSLPEPPRRSILFLHVSGEEHGLLGSEWFSDHPTVPVEQIVANINVDMIGRNSPDSIVVIGKNYSTLGDVVNQAGADHPELGLVVSDDLWPEERFFFRSDHYNFARLEIPAIFFFAGVHEDYHQPSDHLDLIDPDKAARVARLVFYTAERIANDSNRPQWDLQGLEEVRGMTR